MAIERTLSMIKPNITRVCKIGLIEQRIEQAGFKIVAMRMVHLTRADAEAFYAEHKGKSFFEGLVNFMISAPIVAQVLEAENAITRYRELMGATNPAQAATGTLRADFADDLQQNAVHGSDSVTSAQREIAFFFSENDIYSV